jgi:HemY protein
MVRLLIKLLILVIVVLAAVLLVRDDPGVVMLRYRGWTVDTSLAVALGVLIVFMVALYYLIRLLRGRGTFRAGRKSPDAAGRV